MAHRPNVPRCTAHATRQRARPIAHSAPALACSESTGPCAPGPGRHSPAISLAVFVKGRNPYPWMSASKSSLFLSEEGEDVRPARAPGAVAREKKSLVVKCHHLEKKCDPQVAATASRHLLKSLVKRFAAKSGQL